MLVADPRTFDRSPSERPFGPAEPQRAPLTQDPPLDPPSRFWVELDA